MEESNDFNYRKIPEHLNCLGLTLAAYRSEWPEQCAKICDSMQPKCGAFTFDFTSKLCVLKSKCTLIKMAKASENILSWEHRY